MCALLRAGEIKGGTTPDDLRAMDKVGREHFFKRENLRLDAIHKGQHVEVEVFLKFGELVELVQYFLW